MKTKTSTVYPELINTNVANSPDIVYKNTTFMDVIGGSSSTRPIIQNGSKVNPDSLYTYILKKVENSPLNGYVPRDGTQYGLDGTPQSYAKFLTNLARRESSFNNNTVGDVGKFNGGSNGLFQLSPDDALNYRLQSTPFSIQQLRDPYINTDTALKIFESNVLKDGLIYGKSGGKYLGASAYWGPLREGKFRPTDSYKFLDSQLPTTLAATTPTTTNAAANLKKQLDLSTQYWNAKKGPDPINNLTKFFNDLSSQLSGLNSDFIFYWYKKLQAQPDDIKNNVKLDPNSLLNEPSDSVGVLTNSLDNYSDNVSPVWDIPMDYGPPETVPNTVANKLPPATLELSYDMSYHNTQIQKTNQISLQKPNDTTNIATDPTQPHGLNLVSDIPSYQAHNNAVPPAMDCLVNKFGPERFEYLNYFSNMNNQLGYNPRDYSKNLQSMPNFSYQMNVENTPQFVDVLKKKVKPSMNGRTIKRALACKLRTTARGVTTEESNRALLYQTRTVKLATPISFSSKASAQLSSAIDKIRIPNTLITGLTDKIGQAGIPQTPFTNQLLAPLNNLTGAVNSLNGSIGNLASITQITPLNMPNVLPSLDPGSFPQIYSLLSNTSFNNLNSQTIFDTAQQVKGIICDFKLPILGKINWDQIANVDITKNFQDLLNSIVPKLPKLDDFKNALKGLLPDFKGIWDSFYKTFFECENKDDFK